MADGNVLVVGGQTSTYTGSSRLYNISTNSWSSKSSLNQGRYRHTAHLVTVSGGSTRVIVIGGRAGGSTLSTAELYNPTANTWSYTGNNMSHGREYHASVMLNNGKVFVTGGLNNGTPKADTDLYDPVNDSWSTASSASIARYNHAAVLLDDGRVLVAGGQDSGSNLSSTEFYDPSTDTWSTGPSLNTARTEVRMIKLSDGRVLVAGGAASGSTPLYSAEIWDPSSPNTWTSVSSMTRRRYGHSMTLLDDGRVLVAGGIGGLSGQSSSVMANVEVYDPATNTWDNTDSMITARMRYPSVLLDDGSVLVADGFNSTYISDSEYYTLGP